MVGYFDENNEWHYGDDLDDDWYEQEYEDWLESDETGEI